MGAVKKATEVASLLGHLRELLPKEEKERAEIAVGITALGGRRGGRGETVSPRGQ